MTTNKMLIIPIRAIPMDIEILKTKEIGRHGFMCKDK
jgi:hypothetical protein